jgi:Flp pilus assembly protein TadD
MTMRNSRRLAIFAVALPLFFSSGAAFVAQAEPLAYIELEYGPRFYPGDEWTRAGRAHFVHGDYGLAEVNFRRAVEATPFNGAAWLGLAASYDHMKRFDLADRAYRRATRLSGETYLILNNRGYSYALRGDLRRARRFLLRASQLAPSDMTIQNNLAIVGGGQAWFWGAAR